MVIGLSPGPLDRACASRMAGVFHVISLPESFLTLTLGLLDLDLKNFCKEDLKKFRKDAVGLVCPLFGNHRQESLGGGG